MELKLLHKGVVLNFLGSLNRTFMELKRGEGPQITLPLSVLIVPLWN